MGLGRLLLLVAGLASIAYMMSLTGLAALLEPVRTLSWRIVPVLLLPYAAVALLHTAAWRVLFTHAPVSLRRLFAVRLAGEALNLGSASVGGEPVKVYLLRPAVPLAEASAAQVVDKTTITLGQVLFLAAGLAVTFAAFDAPADFLRAMTLLLGVQVGAVAGFVMVQCIGLGGWALRLLRRLGLANGEGRASGLARFDATLAASYRERWGAVAASTLVHLLGWLAGSLEVYLVLRWLGVETSLTAALAIDAFGTGIKFLAFAIPGALGVLEGGYMLVFGVFGLGSGLGLSFTLVRRLRMLLWSGAGLLILAWMRAAPVAARQ
ncbi:MAG TPA: flippase-like domain-containing protein [Methylomirabilota bacterium]|nr:flippase-like domain-containing protein [Methylomirabilota bacterium]